MKSKHKDEIPLPAKVAFTLDELVALGLGSKSLLYSEIRAGRLRTRKQGVRTIVTPQAVKDYVAALPSGGPDADKDASAG